MSTLVWATRGIAKLFRRSPPKIILVVAPTHRHGLNYVRKFNDHKRRNLVLKEEQLQGYSADRIEIVVIYPQFLSGAMNGLVNNYEAEGATVIRLVETF